MSGALTIDEIRVIFAQEAEVRLGRLSQLLLQLEQDEGDDTLVRSIFREIHTLKGSAAVAGLEEVSGCAHELEELVDEVRTGRATTTPALIDTLLAGADRLSQLIKGEVASNHDVASPAPGPRSSPDVGTPAAQKSTPRKAQAQVRAVETSGNAAREGKAKPSPDGGVILVPTERLEELTRLVGESASAHLRVGRMLKDRFGVDPASCTEYNELSRSLNDLQDRATRTQMVQVATITDPLHRAVRDLARAQGKEVRWETRGIDTEMDRGVLQQLSDSLLHLVRNAVDHGIEQPAERVSAGKPSYATIRLHAMQLGSEVIIAVTDDGRGIDTAAVSQRASRQGIETEDLSEQEVLALTFHPGLSTTDFVTDVSGRGVGLDVVRTNVEAVRGRRRR